MYWSVMIFTKWKSTWNSQGNLNLIYLTFLINVQFIVSRHQMLSLSHTLRKLHKQAKFKHQLFIQFYTAFMQTYNSRYLDLWLRRYGYLLYIFSFESVIADKDNSCRYIKASLTFNIIFTAWNCSAFSLSAYHIFFSSIQFNEYRPNVIQFSQIISAMCQITLFTLIVFISLWEHCQISAKWLHCSLLFFLQLCKHISKLFLVK